MKNESLEQINRLADLVGDFIRYWGFKSIHGKIWVHLYVSSKPLDAAALIERLNISKALVSISMVDLLKYGVVRTAGKSDRDTQLYEANPEVRDVILTVLKSREKVMLENISQSYEALKTQHENCAGEGGGAPEMDLERLRAVGRMIGEAQMVLKAILHLQSFNFKDIKLK